MGVPLSNAGLFTAAALAGYWLEEAAAPYCVFSDAGLEVDIASPEGGSPPCDPGSKVRKSSILRHIKRNKLNTSAGGLLLVVWFSRALFSTILALPLWMTLQSA